MSLLSLDDLIGAFERAEETGLDGNRGGRLLLAGVAGIVFQVADLLQSLRMLRIEKNILFGDDGEFGGRVGLTQGVPGHARVHTAVVDRDEFDRQRNVTEIKEICDARTGL